MASPPLLHAETLSKRFYATQALDQVSFTLAHGQVHALVGENGAGKSTLIKILSGVYQADGGIVRIEGNEVRFASPADALADGVVVIPQEMFVVPAQSVAENVMLGNLPTRMRLGFLKEIDRRAMRERASDLLQRLNLEIDPTRMVGALSYAERQLVMIARALSRDARILILDEPTASLEAREVHRLFDVIETLKADGVAIVYVSHRLDEIEQIADMCTVLRDGKLVDVMGRGDFVQEDLIRLMTGRDLEAVHHDESRSAGADVLNIGGDDLDLREREVVGVAGLLGSGTTELLLRAFGAEPARGDIAIKGQSATLSSPQDAIAQGLGLVPGERRQGLIMELTIRENIALPHLQRFKNLTGLDRSAINDLVDELMEMVDIRPRNPSLPVRALSGGNQQKVIFARWLAGETLVLLLDEPTHGIDVGAKAHIHRVMREFAEKGGGILFASSEMTEVMAHSDRVAAMKEGEIVARLDRGENYNEGALRRALGG